MKEYQFNPQFIIENYIVDFVCHNLKLIIKIDGYSHFVKSEEDYKRQTEIEELGYQFLRFSEAMFIYRIDEVVSEIDYAMECIEQKLSKHEKSNPPTPMEPPPFTKRRTCPNKLLKTRSFEITDFSLCSK